IKTMMKVRKMMESHSPCKIPTSVGPPHLAPQPPQVKSINRTLAHPSDLIIGSPSQGVKTRSQHHASCCEHVAFVSSIEPKNVHEALEEVDWVMAMQDELNNLE